MSLMRFDELLFFMEKFAFGRLRDGPKMNYILRQF